MAEDGGTPGPKATADIQMRVVFRARTYTEAGRLMDQIEGAMRPLLMGLDKARFDFIAFNTHPCKMIEMDERAHELMRPIVSQSIGPDEPPY